MAKARQYLSDALLTTGILAGAFCTNFLLHRLFLTPAAPSMLFVLAVFLISLKTYGYLWGILASVGSVLIVNYAFTEPYYDIDFLSPERLTAALVMLTVSILTSSLATKIQRQEKIRAEIDMERTRANLLRAVSHDLRTPLTSIYGSTSAIMENYDSLSRQQQLRLLAAVQEDAQWLIRMVENLLSVTRVGSEGVTVVKTPTVLEELIDAVLVKFHKRWPDKTVTVQIPEEFLSIPMDAMLMEQVLMNLLENAVSHAEGMTELSLTVTKAGRDVLFRVADDGCGIPQERMKKLFDGFFAQSGPPSDGKRSNMGIGLSVCATIVSAHGGEIRAKNRPGGGAEFSFTLKTEDEDE